MRSRPVAMPFEAVPSGAPFDVGPTSESPGTNGSADRAPFFRGLVVALAASLTIWLLLWSSLEVMLLG